jgi:hypothetical protein
VLRSRCAHILAAPVRHQYSRFLRPPLNLRSAEPDPVVSEDDEPAPADLPRPSPPRSQLSSEQRRANAVQALQRHLANKFFNAGAVFQALSTMMEKVAWRLRNGAAGARLWSWSISLGRLGGPFFLDPLQAAMCAFQTYEHEWQDFMVTGEPRVAENDAAILTAARQKLSQHWHQ